MLLRGEIGMQKSINIACDVAEYTVEISLSLSSINIFVLGKKKKSTSLIIFSFHKSVVQCNFYTQL